MRTRLGGDTEMLFHLECGISADPVRGLEIQITRPTVNNICLIPANMPELIPLMLSIRNVFNKYAAKDGDPGSLSKAELSELLRNELMGDVSKGRGRGSD